VTTTPTATVDAGVDAAIVEVVIDAGATKREHPKKDPRKRTSRGNHARPSEQDSATPMDRGD
jgi:hypothetical protein